MKQQIDAQGLRVTEYAMLTSNVDACLIERHWADKKDINWYRGFKFHKPSDHRYRYSMAIGDAWSVKVPSYRYSRDLDGYLPSWIGGSTYEYGYDTPRYPVPALTDKHMNNVGGGIKGDWLRVGAWFVDWSRGSLEVY